LRFGHVVGQRHRNLWALGFALQPGVATGSDSPGFLDVCGFKKQASDFPGDRGDG